MNVNEIYSEIVSFWDNIYPILLFHFIFYIFYRFVFRNISIKFWLETYIESPGFARTKNILERFELWKRLPFILLISALIYLALFNSVTHVVSSISMFPFDFTYSNTDFTSQFEPKEDLLEIAKYGTDTTGDYFRLEQLTQKYLDEYKIKHPERYQSWVGWVDESFGKRIQYLHLLECLLLLLIVTYFIQVRLQKGHRLGITFRMFLVLILSTFGILVLRVQAEQIVEERFAMQVMFVRTELTNDTLQKPILTTAQIERIKNEWQSVTNIKSNHFFWGTRCFDFFYKKIGGEESQRYEILP